MSTKLKDDTFTKELVNGALIFLRSAYWNADRIRGIPADKVFLDEIQDLLMSLIPVVESSLDASPLGHTVMAGTPKAPENPIEQLWQISTQTEWEVPCFAHSPIYWNRLDLGVKNIGKEGLICAKCGKPINPAEGLWVDAFPSNPIKGYHVTQLAVSWKQNAERWKSDIIYKMENWPTDRFYNETLGVSYGTADQPITGQQMAKACYPNSVAQGMELKNNNPSPPRLRAPRWFFGCDWAEGREELAVEGNKIKPVAFSVMVIGTYDARGKFVVAFLKKFRNDERDLRYVRQYVITKIKEWNCEGGIMDMGYGSLMVKDIRAAFPHKSAEYLPATHANQKDLIKFHPQIGLILDRNEFIARIIYDLTQEDPRIIFPHVDDMKEFVKDFTALRSEYSETMRRIRYYHSPTEPDDTVHAVLYAKLAADIAYGKVRPTLQGLENDEVWSVNNFEY